jgi:uncharacterized protein (TIGR03000 family)
MYSVVLMAALTTGGHVADFGRGGGRCSDCNGGCSCSCSYGGCWGCSGCWGRGYGGRRGCSGCYGGCYGCYGGGRGGCSGGSYGCYGGYGCGSYAYGTSNPTARTYSYGSAPVTYDTARAPAATTDRPARLIVHLPARLIVHLPADARLTVNNTPSTQTSSRRIFNSPPLEPGWRYSYTLKAEVLRDGQRLTTTQQVTVQPGRETDVRLNIPSGTASARR